MERFMKLHEIKSNPLLFLTQKEKWKQRYLLVRIKKKTTFEDVIELSKNYKLVLLDPGVCELRKVEEYENIEKLHKFVQLIEINKLTNIFISIDYPCDMLKGNRYQKYTKKFIRRTNKNNLKYQNHDQYICTLQSKYKNFKSFEENFERLETIWIENPKKMIGMGNLCRIMRPCSYTNNVFHYIRNSSLKQVNNIHFYGLPFKIIVKYIPPLLKEGFKISVDSTKWTFANSKKCKESVSNLERFILKPNTNGFYGCTPETRELFFKEYIKKLEMSNLEVIY